MLPQPLQTPILIPNAGEFGGRGSTRTGEGDIVTKKRAFLVYFVLQALSLTLWFYHELTGAGLLQFWFFVFLLAAIPFAWPIYLRYRSQFEFKFKTMVWHFSMALAGILLANLLWMLYWYIFVRRSDAPIVWSEDIIVIELFLFFQIALCTIFYWLSMAVFSKLIARGLHNLRESESAS